jgi:pyruvate,orthophosphate dikinase
LILKRQKSSSGKPVILVRDDISTTDIVGMAACQCTITRTGGKTSHAAIVAQQMNKICIVGCQALMIDRLNRKCNIANKVLKKGDYISLDGNTGNVYVDKVEFETEKPEKLLERFRDGK